MNECVCLFVFLSVSCLILFQLLRVSGAGYMGGLDGIRAMSETVWTG